MVRLAMCLLVCLGCSESSRLEVRVQTDLIAGREFSSISAQLDDGAPRVVPAMFGADYSLGQPVATFLEVTDGSHTVRASLFDNESQVIDTRAVVVSVSGDTAATVILGCRDCEEPDASIPPSRDAGMRDVGAVDADMNDVGAQDAALDGGSTDAQLDGGIADGATADSSTDDSATEPDAGDGEVSDASTDAGCTWGPWGPPELLAGASHPSLHDFAPALSPDGLTLVVSREVTDGGSDYDLVASERSGPGAEFVPAMPLQINSSELDGAPSFTGDGRGLLFTSRRSGRNLLYRATRATPSDLFGDVVEVFSDWVHGADVSSDSLLVFVHRVDGADDDIFTLRQSADVYGFPMLVPAINSSNDERHPSISSDGLELYFHIEGDTIDTRLMRAVRARADDDFDPPEAILTTFDGTPDAPDISEDGYELFFAALVGSATNYDIYRSTRECLP